MKILIVGAGYVGLTSATVFAGQHEVVVVDNDKEKIRKIKKGENVISEPDLHLNQKKLKFSTSVKKVMDDHVFDFIFLCVGTPLIGQTGFTQENQLFDLSMLEKSVEEIILNNKHGNDLNLIIKSTVLPGTAKKIKEKALSLAKDLVQKKKTPFHIEVISNPEFLREGYAVADVRYPSRVVIGLNKKSSHHDSLKRKIENFYKSSDIQPLVFVDNETAELSKLSANAFLANKISFMNEQMSLAQMSGANINDIVSILEMDARIGKYINPGIGYGGYCLPKDVVALKSYAQSIGVESKILDSIHDTNMKQMKLIVNKIEDFILQSNKSLKVGVYGIAFKNNTRDSREAPAIYIAEQLKEREINVFLIDDKITLEKYHGNVAKGTKDLEVDIILLANKVGYDLFTKQKEKLKKLKLVIDPLRLLKKEEKIKLNSEKIEYCIIN